VNKVSVFLLLFHGFITEGHNDSVQQLAIRQFRMHNCLDIKEVAEVYVLPINMCSNEGALECSTWMVLFIIVLLHGIQRVLVGSQ